MQRMTFVIFSKFSLKRRKKVIWVLKKLVRFKNLLTVESPPPESKYHCWESWLQMKARQETNLTIETINEP